MVSTKYMKTDEKGKKVTPNNIHNVFPLMRTNNCCRLKRGSFSTCARKIENDKLPRSSIIYFLLFLFISSNSQSLSVWSPYPLFTHSRNVI